MGSLYLTVVPIICPATVLTSLWGTMTVLPYNVLAIREMKKSAEHSSVPCAGFSNNIVADSILWGQHFMGWVEM